MTRRLLREDSKKEPRNDGERNLATTGRGTSQRRGGEPRNDGAGGSDMEIASGGVSRK
ncbi:MAG: hypothetical protein FWG98_09390 [Candidatus Cloacimonetes bacterium]|nr:hypothetical protein [Candidatus Cloacimonadota bacterium]